MKKIIFLKHLVFLFGTNLPFSQQIDKPIIANFLLEGGVEYGGDEILKVFFTNGNDQTMKAGQGGIIAIGGQFEFAKVRNLMLRTTLGIKYNTTAADNANIRFTRLPITVIPYLKIKNDYRLGIGITTHQRVKFKGDGFFPDETFKSTTGARFEFGYKWVALTYTSINYKLNNETISAGSLGVSATYILPTTKKKSR